MPLALLEEEGLIHEKVFFLLVACLFCIVFNESDQYGYMFTVVTVG